MARLRTFVAVDISDEIRESGAALIQNMALTGVDARWVRPENFHLTLKFLGDVEDRELHDVCKITAQAAKEGGRFPLPCQGIGAFPNVQKPNTVWMGVDDELGNLSTLQKRLENLMCDQLGIPVERRPYHGHVTLGKITARGQNSPELIELLTANSTEEFGMIRVEELVIYSSELSRKGPSYTVIGRCPLPK